MIAPAPDAYLRRYELEVAIEGWRGEAGRPASPCQRFEAAQGVVLALLRHADPDRASALHDANRRKALSISPVTIRPLNGNLARATLGVGVWEPALADLIHEALLGATDAPLTLVGRPAVLLAWRLAGAWTCSDLLLGPPAATVSVRFTSPTLFGFGRHPDGSGRLHLTPDPGPVVASWLRAWKLTDDRTLDWLPTSPEALGETIGLVGLRDVHTAVVDEPTAALTGFLGECSYRWHGREAAGRPALAALARFATICGTGAKTGRGFGQTEALAPALPAGR
ncbi:MAG: CRISPR system precrRNA processing endoribonuclease RAMP protein Cas6 [Chloroflexi bacterium]|nr:CRISPR system precrRNA processing endoribonuclease RAMP protein Cas6 [Chloroflexota bacterium]